MYRFFFMLLLTGCAQFQIGKPPVAGPMGTRTIPYCRGNKYMLGEIGKLYRIKVTSFREGSHSNPVKVWVEGQDMHEIWPGKRSIEVAGPAVIRVGGCSSETRYCRNGSSWQVACSGYDVPAPTMKFFRPEDADKYAPPIIEFEAYEVQTPLVSLANVREGDR